MSAEGTQSARGTKLYTIRQNHEIKGQYNDFHGFWALRAGRFHGFGLSGAAKDLELGPDLNLSFLFAAFGDLWDAKWRPTATQGDPKHAKGDQK